MCIRVCSVCKVTIGRNECPCNQLTHGYCETCYQAALREVEKIEAEVKKNNDHNRKPVQRR